MCTTAKYCLIAAVVAIVISVFLWYRNWTCDRLVAVATFGLGILQLLSYGCHSSMKKYTTGALIAFTIWVLVLAYIFTIYVYSGSGLAMCLTIATAILVLYITYGIVTSSQRYVAYTYPGRSIPTWASVGANGEEEGMIGNLVYFMVAVLVLGWLIMLGHSGWSDVTLYALAAFVIVTAVLVPLNYKNHQFSSYWTYLLVGIGLIALLIGSFCPPQATHDGHRTTDSAFGSVSC